MAPKAAITKENYTRAKKTKQNPSKTKVSKAKSVIKNPIQFLAIKCPICFENINKEAVSSTKCGHVFCTGCLLKALKRMSVCPTCRTRLKGPRGHHALYLDTNMCEQVDYTPEYTIDDNSK